GAVAGSATVWATSGSVVGIGSVTVGNAGPSVATPASATPDPVAGATTALSVLGADDGGEPNLTYSWSVLAKPVGAPDPTYGANGTNGAKATTATFGAAGAYTFLVTITDGGGLSTTDNVDVTVIQTLTSIVVSPGTAALNLNGTRSFTAVGLDQFSI